MAESVTPNFGGVKMRIEQTSRWFWFVTATDGIMRVEGGKFALGERRAIAKAQRWKARLERQKAFHETRREL